MESSQGNSNIKDGTKQSANVYNQQEVSFEQGKDANQKDDGKSKDDQAQKNGQPQKMQLKHDKISKVSKKKYKLKLDDFSLQNQIGSGSFGKVYKVKHKKTREIYAAKISKEKFENDSSNLIHDLSREVNIIAKLNHPSVLKFIFFSPTNFKNKLKPVIITEYASNNSLDKLIDSERKSPNKSQLNDTRKLIIIYGIAEAMAYLHSHEIIHRDLKPENILLDDYLFPKIADFGLSKIDHSYRSMTGDTINGMFKGTPRYMAPEIYSKTNYSKASDVYAFALIVYEIVTIKVPFESLNYWQLMVNASKGERPKFDKQIPASYKKLIETCWSQNPLERPTFDQILYQLRNDKGFITESVNEEEYLNYIKYIKECNVSFDSSKKTFDIDSFTKPQIIQLDDTKIKLLQNDVFQLFPLNEYMKLNDDCKKLVDSSKEDPEKQFIIGKSLIECCNHFPLNAQIGIKYLKESMKNGNKDSLIYYINLLIKGKIIPQNLKKARKLIDMHLQEVKSASLLLSGKILLKENKYKEAKSNLEESSKLGNSESLYELAKIFCKGVDCPINHEKEIALYKQSCEMGYIKAYYKYGLIIIDKYPERKQEGINYILQSADKGYPKAMHYYSELVKDIDKNSSDNLNLSNKYLKNAADQGHLDSMYK